MLFEHEYYSVEDILRVASKAEGKEVGCFDINGRLKVNGNKGQIGHVIQEGLFNMPLDTRPEADFQPIGIELKVTGLKKHKNKKSYSAKERLVLSKINYMEEYKNSFEKSTFWQKNQKLAIMFYAWEAKKTKNKFKIIKTLIHEFSPEDLVIIKRDWNSIMKKVKKGLAHEISERDTIYLSACTKGRNGNELVSQPFSNIGAKPRAYALKASYITAFVKRNLNNESVIKLFDLEELERESIEDLLISRFEKFYGSRIDEILEDDKIDLKDKAIYYRVANKIMGLDNSDLSESDEFLKANIRVKTIRLEPNGRPKESMSFENIDFKRWIIDDWEESQIFQKFEETKFLFVVFQYRETEKENPNRIAYLKFVKWWTMPKEILEGPVKDFWQLTRQRLINGVKFTNKNGKTYNNLPSSTENPVCHVRSKAKLSKVKTQLPDGQLITKQSYWLNREYIICILGNIE